MGYDGALRVAWQKARIDIKIAEVRSLLAGGAAETTATPQTRTKSRRNSGLLQREERHGTKGRANPGHQRQPQRTRSNPKAEALDGWQNGNPLAPPKNDGRLFTGSKTAAMGTVLAKVASGCCGRRESVPGVCVIASRRCRLPIWSIRGISAGQRGTETVCSTSVEFELFPGRSTLGLILPSFRNEQD